MQRSRSYDDRCPAPTFFPKPVPESYGVKGALRASYADADTKRYRNEWGLIGILAAIKHNHVRGEHDRADQTGGNNGKILPE
jgi:hypothetical protein